MVAAVAALVMAVLVDEAYTVIRATYNRGIALGMTPTLIITLQIPEEGKTVAGREANTILLPDHAPRSYYLCHIHNCQRYKTHPLHISISCTIFSIIQHNYHFTCVLKIK